MKKNFLGILIVVMASAFMFIGCKGYILIDVIKGMTS